MKLFRSLALIPLLLVLISTNIYAETVYTEGALNYTINNGTITIVEYFGSEPEVIIPNSINNVPVTKIADNAFVDSNVKSVIIPDSVLDISNVKLDSGVAYKIVDESFINQEEDPIEPINNEENNNDNSIDDINEEPNDVEIEIEEDELFNNEEIDNEVIETGDIQEDFIDNNKNETIVIIKTNETSSNDTLLLAIIISILLIVGIFYFLYSRKKKNEIK